jgi:2-dehydro-3-deoxyglucarate aldolase/4-hydroxy-2-oxoheptanedioate aldolase
MEKSIKKGTIIALPTPESSEIMSDAGFDWVLIDMEHSSMSLSHVEGHLRALGSGVTSIVRVPDNDDVWIKRVLDTGCDGIMVPMVKSAEEAGRAIAASFYPPKGTRSVGITRAHRFGTRFSEYLEKESSGIEILLQVEHIDSVTNINSIADTEGLTGLFIGPYDLSASMGMAGRVNDKEVMAAIDTVVDVCNSKSVPWGIFGADPRALKGWIEKGATWVLCGIDSVMLSARASEVIKLLKL